MHESEKNFLERFADQLPGIKGYRDKEARRDTDKRLREYMAAELDRYRRGLDRTKQALLGGGKLELLGEVDRIADRMAKVADGIRFASYGYSGLFDQVKIQDEELAELYRYDGELLDGVRSLGARIDELSGATEPVAALGVLRTAVDELDGRVESRKQLFNNPAR